MSPFCAVLCSIFLMELNAALDVGPKIIRDSDVEDLVIDAGSNYTLICLGSQKLKWTYPHPASEAKQKWTTFTTTSSTTNDSDYTYRSELIITSISYPFVGYYTCHYETSDDQDRIYLYVNDTEHLSVEDSYKLHYAVQYKETTIPCRPTAPDVEVKFLSYSDDNIKSKFNPKSGFTFVVYDITFADAYYCVFTHPRTNKTIELSLLLKIDPYRAYLPTPYIEDQSHNHTDAGKELKISCYLQESSPNVYFHWITPRGDFSSKGRGSGDVTVATTKNLDIAGKKFLMSELTIRNCKIEDTGTYGCQVQDRQGNNASTVADIVVHDTNDCYIEIREANDLSSITVNANQPVQWILDVIAHPPPDLTWYDNRNNVVRNTTTFHTEFDGSKAFFKISNALLENAGPYKLRGISRRGRDTKNCPKETEFELYLTVNDKPSVCLTRLGESCKSTEILAPNIYLLNQPVEFECTAIGNPLPTILWEVKSCFSEECQFVKISEKDWLASEPYSVIGVFQVDTTRDGLVKCVASNALGSTDSTISYHVSDVKDGFAVDDFTPGSIVSTDQTASEVIIAENDTLHFTCGVSPKRSDSLDVFFNGELLSERHHKDTVKTDLSTKIKVTLNYVQLNDSGMYTCRIRNKYDRTFDYRNITLRVKEPQEPTIIATNLNSDIVVDYPKMEAELVCRVTGIPKPSIEWYKENMPIQPSERIVFKNDNMTLFFNGTEVNDEGVYRCNAFNSIGSAFKESTLTFKVKPISVTIYYYLTGTIAVLLLIALAYIFIRIRKEKKLRRELKLLGLENFHNGSPENLNPELGIDDQAELLPYNKKFEFPIEHLKIGRQLGSGAFGVVMRAEAKAIIPGEPTSTVAVKMVKKNADQSYIKALASELKIMVHLGKHINVVNLLGACTKNVAKRELLVIVEFCRFGNLQNFIYKHRETYINQVDPVTGNIDYYIGADILERTYSVSSENCNNSIPSNSMQDYRDRGRTMSTQITSNGDESMIMSNNSAQPEWRLNYRGDYRGDVKPISTRDLLTWSFQVARGMEYLASRKVLHGDLAARNILLADNNVVKICDFGLAKTMYNDNNYKKKGNNPLPIKWMAIESIRDRVFSTQSDVWSFGIVLWEFFSLARTPYPGMEADERLYHKLLDGYRMESPPYAPREIYRIMLDCWHFKVSARPSFTNLAEKIGILLEDSVRKHYVDLNDPYLKMNTEKLEDNDYLAMLSPPSFDVLSTPSAQYANVDMFAQHTRLASEGYLYMGASKIFSPRIEPGNVFMFQSDKRKESQGEESQELYPMMLDGEGETGYLMPIEPLNSVSNPLYHHVPTSEVKNDGFLKTPDNYISMPQYKNLVNNSFKEKPPIQIDVERGNNRACYVNDKWNAEADAIRDN